MAPPPLPAGSADAEAAESTDAANAETKKASKPVKSLIAVIAIIILLAGSGIWLLMFAIQKWQEAKTSTRPPDPSANANAAPGAIGRDTRRCRGG